MAPSLSGKDRVYFYLRRRIMSILLDRPVVVSMAWRVLRDRRSLDERMEAVAIQEQQVRAKRREAVILSPFATLRVNCAKEPGGPVVHEQSALQGFFTRNSGSE